MNVGLAQINTRVGDLVGNSARIRAASEAAMRAGACIIAFPELTITGYPPRDLLFDASFLARARAAIEQLALDLAGAPPIVVGAPWSEREATAPGGRLNNAALVLEGGRIAHVVPKRLLPAYDIFHEPRWFAPGARAQPIDLTVRT